MSSEHTWTVVTLTHPTWCNFCMKMIFGLVRQAVRCTDCGFVSHKRCRNDAGQNCTRVSKHNKERSLRQTADVENMDDLERAMRQPGSGLAVYDRRIKLKEFKHCFVGSDLVDWVVTNLPVRTRSDALTLCQRMMELRHFECCAGKTVFRDDSKAYYSFLSDEVPELDVSEFKSASGGGGGGSSSSASQPGSGTSSSSVSLENFTLLKIIGKGGFGKVLKVKKKDTGKVYAMKVMDKSLFTSEKHIRSLMSERNIMLNDCPYLVHLYFSFQSEEKLYFVMDFVSGGDLAFYFDKLGVFSDEVTCFMAAELILALEFLHACGVIYRDLKPENILIDRDGHVVLTDFGLSKELLDQTNTATLCGTPTYLAPEVVGVMSGGRYDARIDLWSLGVVIYEMLTGYNPFDADQFDDVVTKIKTVTPKYSRTRISEEAEEVIRGLLERDPKKRLDADALKKCAWFKSIEWDSLRVKKLRSPFRVDGEDNFDEQSDTIVDIMNERNKKGGDEKKDAKFSNIDYAVPKIIESPQSGDVGSTGLQRSLSQSGKDGDNAGKKRGSLSRSNSGGGGGGGGGVVRKSKSGRSSPRRSSKGSKSPKRTPPHSPKKSGASRKGDHLAPPE